VDVAKLDPANEGKLVYVSGDATIAETLQDPVFKISVPALKLTREVEIYQWTERSETKTESQLGGKEKKTTSYYHEKKWVKEPVPSGSFKPDDGPYKGQVIQNVGTKPYPDATERAKEVKLGAYQLTASQVDRLGNG